MSRLAQMRSTGHLMETPLRIVLRTIGRVVLYFAFLLTTFLVVLPIIWVVLVSLKTQEEYMVPRGRVFPEEPQWDNYRWALFDEHGGWFNMQSKFIQRAKNSLLIAIPTMVMTVFSSSLAAFGFARHRAPLRNFLFVLVLAMMMVPGIVTIIPQFVLYARLRLTNTYWPWYLGAMAGAPFNIFLFRQFFASIPKELEDAAEVDGCSRFRIYWQIFLPNSLPAIAVVSIFHFQWAWGDWFLPRIYLRDEQSTLAMWIQQGYSNPMGIPYNTVTLAACVLFMLPLIVIFVIAQRYIIQGVVTTGIKG